MMHDPRHHGEIFKEEVPAPLGLGMTEAAQRLGVARTTSWRFISEDAGISPDLAVRPEAASAGSARVWLDMQTQYEH